MTKRRVKRDPVVQPPDQSIRYIALTRGQIAIVDTADYEWLNQWNWIAVYLGKSSKYWYAQRAHGGPMMHAFILGCVKGERGDHINHATLDNRRENLRKSTASQNAYNQGMRKTNTCGYKGVNFLARLNKYAAQIQIDGKKRHIGVYMTAEEAHAAYCEAAKQHHGEFAHF